MNLAQSMAQPDGTIYGTIYGTLTEFPRLPYPRSWLYTSFLKREPGDGDLGFTLQPYQGRYYGSKKAQREQPDAMPTGFY